MWSLGIKFFTSCSSARGLLPFTLACKNLKIRYKLLPYYGYLQQFYKRHD